MIKHFSINCDRVHGPSRRPGRLVVAVVLAALICPLAGCSFGGSAGGQGTVDIGRAKEASTRSNSSPSKGAAVRERAGVADVLKKKGRR